MNEKEIKEAVKELHDNVFGQFRARRLAWRSLRLGQQAVQGIPEDFKDIGLRYVSRRGMHASAAYQAALQASSPSITVKDRTGKPADQVSAQKFEGFVNRGWEIMSSTAFPATTAGQVNDGVGLYKLGLINPLWPDRPQRNGQRPTRYAEDVAEYKRQAPFPFYLEAPDPTACFWWEDADGVSIAGEKSKRAVHLIHSAYPDSPALSRVLGSAAPTEGSFQSFSKTVEFIELQTSDTIYHCLYGKDKVEKLAEYPNPFATPAYIPVPGRYEPGTDPDLMYHPLIEELLETLPFESYVVSLRLIAGHLTAIPTYDIFRKVPTGDRFSLDPANFVKTISIRPGVPVDAVVDEEVFDIRPRQLPAGIDLDKLEVALAERLDRYDFRGILAGESQGDRTPAWSTAQLIENAQAQMNPAKINQEAALIKMSKMIGGAIKNHIKEEVHVWVIVRDDAGQNRLAKSVSPADIGEFDISADLRIQSTSIMLAMLEAMSRMQERGFISRQTMAEDVVRVKDWPMEQRRMDREDLESIFAGIARQMTVALGMKRLEDELGVPIPGGVTPPVPEGPVPTRGRTRGGTGEIRAPATESLTLAPGQPGG